MEQLPPIPEEARRHFVMGGTIFKEAKSAENFSLATREFLEAAKLAPWWAEARYNLALTEEAAGNYSGAMADLKLYQLFKLPDAEARAAQDKIYALEAKQQMKASGDAAKATEEGQAKDWIAKLNGARFSFTKRFGANPPEFTLLYTIGVNNGEVVFGATPIQYSPEMMRNNRARFRKYNESGRGVIRGHSFTIRPSGDASELFWEFEIDDDGQAVRVVRTSNPPLQFGTEAIFHREK